MPTLPPCHSGHGPTKNRLSLLPKQGVGILYNPSLRDFFRTESDAFDFVEVIPDMFWTDRGAGHDQRFIEIEGWVEVLDWLAARCPITAHNIGLSLGTAGWRDDAYLQQLARWHARYGFGWHSDHMSFVKVAGTAGHEHNAGLAVPVPYDDELLQMITLRIAEIHQCIPAAFLVENNVYFVEIPEQDMTETQFLNQLSAESGCGVLLDIHNVYANARNHGFSAFDFIDSLDLTRVAEIHIAGGSESADMYTDSHSGPCPEPVWELLDYTVPRVPNLCGITFEFHDSYFPLLGIQGIRHQLDRAREAWVKRCKAHVVA